jgi:diadenosine tetraphosphate (Ap4A) HIT family hydrolase
MDSQSSRTNCLLCEEMVSGSGLSSRLGLYRTDAEKILIESRHFALIPDINPLVPGHSLLITKKHLNSFAQLPNSWLCEFTEIQRAGTSYVEQMFGSPMQFEHGSKSDSARSGVCIQHAHIHLIPATAPVEQWMEEYGDLDEIDVIFPQLASLVTSQDYLCYQNQDGRGYLLHTLELPVPCQFIRRQLAMYLSLPAWNWKGVLGMNRLARAQRDLL